MNDKTYHWCKWHKAWVIHGQNVTSGIIVCKLRLTEESGYHNNNTIITQGKSDSSVQVQATQALVSDLVNTLQSE